MPPAKEYWLHLATCVRLTSGARKGPGSRTLSGTTSWTGLRATTGDHENRDGQSVSNFCARKAAFILGPELEPSWLCMRCPVLWAMSACVECATFQSSCTNELQLQPTSLWKLTHCDCKALPRINCTVLWGMVRHAPCTVQCTKTCNWASTCQTLATTSMR